MVIFPFFRWICILLSKLLCKSEYACAQTILFAALDFNVQNIGGIYISLVDRFLNTMTCSSFYAPQVHTVFNISFSLPIYFLWTIKNSCIQRPLTEIKLMNQ